MYNVHCFQHVVNYVYTNQETAPTLL